jgi:hypothetical protein
LLLTLTAVVAIVFFLLPRFTLPPSYHQFADQCGFLGIRNFGDVVSNVPFAVIGLCGLLFLLRSNEISLREHFVDSRERWPYLFVFFGLVLTSLGSSYYHLDPNNTRLVWDRLPMTIVFTAMVAAVIVERVSLRAVFLLPVLSLAGLGSVLQWYVSELRGAGDLRLYVAVQVYSALVLLMSFAFPARYDRDRDLGVVIAFYVLAKILEVLDKPIFRATSFISGHTLKHLAAAAAGYCILRMVRRRRPVPA